MVAYVNHNTHVAPEESLFHLVIVSHNTDFSAGHMVSDYWGNSRAHWTLSILTLKYTVILTTLNLPLNVLTSENWKSI